MNHRSYQGKVLYLTDDVGEQGREWFHVTIQPDGTRTMRATCEMDDDRLLRDVVMTVDKDWYPLDAFVRLSINEQLVGTSWFRFTEHTAECEGYITEEGRVSQQVKSDDRILTFGAHPVHGDAWGLALLKRDKDLDPGTDLNYSSSHEPNGGSGPRLVPSRSDFTRKKYIGPERIEVAAGAFDVEHFQFLVADYPPIDIWAKPPDCIPIKLRWDLLKQTYELVELTGDPA